MLVLPPPIEPPLDRMGQWSRIWYQFLGQLVESANAQRWKTVLKSSDEAITEDTDLSDDFVLQFGVKANKTYVFCAEVFYDTPAAADFKYDVNGPGSPTLVRIETKSRAPGATEIVASGQTAFAFGPNTITTASATPGWIGLSGFVQNGVNAGTVSIRWAQNSSSASATTVRAGSFLKYAVI